MAPGRQEGHMGSQSLFVQTDISSGVDFSLQSLVPITLSTVHGVLKEQGEEENLDILKSLIFASFSFSQSHLQIKDLSPV